MFSLFLAKIDCKWGPYGNWSDCTKSCGGGFQTRLRDIEQQAQNGGGKCEGDYVVLATKMVMWIWGRCLLYGVGGDLLGMEFAEEVIIWI